MARRRRKGNNENNQKRSENTNQVKKQGFGSDLKPTRCSKCRFNRKDEPCYKMRKLLAGLEYTDCVPALIHYSEKKLMATGLVKREVRS